MGAVKDELAAANEPQLRVDRIADRVIAEEGCILRDFLLPSETVMLSFAKPVASRLDGMSAITLGEFAGAYPKLHVAWQHGNKRAQCGDVLRDLAVAVVVERMQVIVGGVISRFWEPRKAELIYLGGMLRNFRSLPIEGWRLLPVGDKCRFVDLWADPVEGEVLARYGRGPDDFVVSQSARKRDPHIKEARRRWEIVRL